MRRSLTVHCLALVALLATLLPATPAAAEPFADPAVEANWSRADLPVAARMTDRSWLWGPEPRMITVETYREGYLEREIAQTVSQPSQKRLVYYFDKARMELTNPSMKNRGGITNGLLVVEMVNGQLQLGDAFFGKGYAPAEVAVAGDPLGVNPGAPTYRSFLAVATLDSVTNRAQNRVNEGVTATISRAGTGGDNPSLAGAVTISHFDENFGHNIPNVFWEFMNRTGPVFVVQRHKAGDKANQPVFKPEGGLAGEIVEQPLFNWIETMGYPVTEPYWSNVRVGGQEKPVLIQLFQRRVLTYTPSNPPATQVEMGNVGQHYYEWRYGGVPVGATVTTALKTTNAQPVLRYVLSQPPAFVGPAFTGGREDDQLQQATGTFVILRLTLTNISAAEQKVGRDLVLMVTTPRGVQRVEPVEAATNAMNEKAVGPRPGRCPATGCPQPPRIWTGIAPGQALDLHLVFDIPTDATGVRLVPAIEDAPGMVLR
jgi:hypothetical protein